MECFMRQTGMGLMFSSILIWQPIFQELSRGFVVGGQT